LAQVANQLVKSKVGFRQSGKVIGLNRKEFWSIGATRLMSEKEIWANGKEQVLQDVAIKRGTGC
jgi:hypothetical protein